MLQNAYFLAKIGADTAENERNCLKTELADLQKRHGEAASRVQASHAQARAHFSAPGRAAASSILHCTACVFAADDFVY